MFKNNHFAAFAVLVSLVGAPLPALAQCAYGDVTSAHCVPFTPPTAYPGYERPSQSQIDAANARRQAKIDRQIEQYRNTQYYGAVAISPSEEVSASDPGYKSSSKAQSKAMDICKNDDCSVVYTYSNTCVAAASSKALGVAHFVIVADPNPKTAFNKASAQCEAQYGKGRCNMWFEGKANCVGYDYGIYNQ